MANGHYFEVASGTDSHALALDHGLHEAGEGVSYTRYYADPNRTQPLGVYWWHGCPDLKDYAGGDRPGQAPFDKWGTSSLEPLTMIGSLLCSECQRHGWIRDGRWVPA